MKVFLRVALALTVMLCLPLSVSASYHYNNLANFRSFGYGINSSGQVIGEAIKRIHEDESVSSLFV
jgi:hypothetical protein